ncbi:hypothetical protein AB0H58_16755 [Nocardia neocaledoniensis]|uniref:hypothetical protein n=1 Tax=Nocardia neocaledoniensis TaxID=236511 RepID=UPI0033C164EC
MTTMESLEADARKASDVAAAAAAKLDTAREQAEARIDEALRANAEDLWNRRRFDARAERDRAQATLDALIADPASARDLTKLWSAFLDLKAISARAGAITSTAMSEMDRHRPLGPTPQGVERTHGGAYGQRTTDPHVNTTFSALLDHIGNQHAEQARVTATAAEQQRITELMVEAEHAR